MATLTNTKIKDTYDGLLKTTDNEALDVSGVTLIEDGLGNASALSVGRSGNGVSVSGLLDVSGEVQGTSLDINGAADISGNLAVDTNTLYVDAASNEVGIGITPETKLDVLGNLRVRRAAASTQYTEIESGGGESIIRGKNNASSLYQALIFESGNNATTTERMRIDSSGNVGIGTDVIPFDGLRINGTGSRYLNITSGAGASAGILLGDSNDTFDGGIVYDNSSQSMLFYSADSERMRIDSSGYLRLAGAGIQFNGDTAAANALDDYEEGTFTPTMSGYSGVTYSSQIGHYTKIGRFVQVSFYMSISNIGTFTGNSFINGLPFSVGTTQAFATGGQLNIMTALNVTRDEHFAGFYNGTTNLFIYSKSGLTTYNGNNHQAGIYSGTLTYFV